LILLCLILALSGLEIRQQSNRLAVAFLLDRSDSIPPSIRKAAINAIKDEIQAMGPEDQAGLIVFGGDALIEQAVSSNLNFETLQSIPRGDETDIAAAIRLAQAILPTGYARRIMLYTDGKETIGNALEAASQAQLAGIDLVVNPIFEEFANEVQLTGASLPSRMAEGDIFNLALGISAAQNTSADVRVFANGNLIRSQAIQISSGEKTYALPMEAGGPGFVRYTVQLNPQVDTLAQNNEVSAYTMVTGPSSILLVVPPEGEKHPLLQGPRPDEGSALEDILQRQGFRVIRRTPSWLPNDLTELGGFDALILVDVPADQLTDRQMQTIQGYVRNLGGGLITVGGPTSYGVGGYYETPLEESLPVEMRLQDDARKASVTIAFVIDQSGSMAEISGGASKLDLAKEATIRSIQLMFPGDRVGVVSFDDVARWVVPLSTLTESASVISEVGRIRSAGGTDILAGLQAVASELPAEESTVRHIILLTDGGADPTGIPELTNQLKTEHNITLTTIGVGQNAAPYLSNLAQIGGGRYHFAATPGSIPSIFTLETSLVSRAYLVEEEFYPEIGAPSPVLMGINETPKLLGYIATSSKPAARVVLTALDGDPLLATWQYGLGTAAAFTSDATGRWGQDWVTWDGFPTFWGQLVKFILRSPSPPLFDTEISQEEGATKLSLYGESGDGMPLNGYQIEALITDPNLSRSEALIEQVAPGRYEGTFSAPDPGAYLIQISGRAPKGQDSLWEDTIGWVRPYSAEYQINLVQASVLDHIVAETRARTQPASPWHAFTRDIQGSTTIAPVWPWLLALACLLLPLDIATRRIALPIFDLRGMLSKIYKRREPSADGDGFDPARADQLEALSRAKARAQTPTEVPAIKVPPPSGAELEPENISHVPPSAQANAGAENQETEGKLKAPDSQPAEPQGSPRSSLASELLARKREKKKKR
jgi:uncharacterized membrane protein